MISELVHPRRSGAPQKTNFSPFRAPDEPSDSRVFEYWAPDTEYRTPNGKWRGLTDEPGWVNYKKADTDLGLSPRWGDSVISHPSASSTVVRLSASLPFIIRCQAGGAVGSNSRVRLDRMRLREFRSSAQSITRSVLQLRRGDGGSGPNLVHLQNERIPQSRPKPH